MMQPMSAMSGMGANSLLYKMLQKQVAATQALIDQHELESKRIQNELNDYSARGIHV